MDMVTRLVQFGFLAMVSLFAGGCATLGRSPGVMLESTAAIMHREGIVCRTEATLLELVASSSGEDLAVALAALNEKYAAEYKGESACVFGAFSYIPVSSTSPRMVEIDGVRHVVQKIVAFGTVVLPDGSIFVFKSVSEGYRVTQVDPPPF